MRVDNSEKDDSTEEEIKGKDRPLPPGYNPDTWKKGEPSRESVQKKGEESYYDPEGGEWHYHPEDRWHNPHWDYKPPGNPNLPWQQVPIGDKPPLKG